MAARVFAPGMYREAVAAHGLLVRWVAWAECWRDQDMLQALIADTLAHFQRVNETGGSHEQA